MKVEVGKAYRTRDGRKAYVARYARTSDYPYGGNIESKPFSWKEDGTWSEPHGQTREDLIEEWTEPQPKEQTMPAEPKFKVGDRVFHVGHGVGEVTEIDQRDSLAIRVEFHNNKVGWFTLDGMFVDEHTIPQLLTLDEARAKGYDVPKKTYKMWQWLYHNSSYYKLTRYHYRTKEEAEEDHIMDDLVFIKPIEETEITVEE